MERVEEDTALVGVDRELFDLSGGRDGQRDDAAHEGGEDDGERASCGHRVEYHVARRPVNLRLSNKLTLGEPGLTV